MLQVRSFLIRKLAALLTADAKRNLESYLKTYIRPEFLEKVKIDSILGPMVLKIEALLGRPVDDEIFKEELVDNFFKPDQHGSVGGDRVLGLLMSHAEDKGLSEEEARIVVNRGVLTPELREKIKDLQDEIGKILYSYLRTTFQNFTQEYYRAHMKEDPQDVLRGKGKGVIEDEEEIAGKGRAPLDDEEETEGEASVLDEKVLEDELKDQYSWEKTLIKDTIDYINHFTPKKEKRPLYLKILKDFYLPKALKTPAQIASEFGIPETKAKQIVDYFIKGKSSDMSVSDFAEKLKVPLSDMRIMEDHFTTKDPVKKTIDQIAKETGIPGATVHRAEKELMGLLKDFYKSRRDVMRHVGPGQKDEEIEIPDYRSYLKGKEEEQKDLYTWLEDTFKDSGKGSKGASELTLAALKLFAQGLTTSEIVEKLSATNSNIKKIKTVYFNPGYESWYLDKEKEKQIRKAYTMFPRKAQETIDYDSLHEGAIIKRTPEEIAAEKAEPKKDTLEPKKRDPASSPEGSGLSSTIHKNRIDQAFDKNRINVVVKFSSDFDYAQLSNKLKKPDKDITREEKDGANFKWVSYRASIEEDFGKHSIYYNFEQKLTDDGKLEGPKKEILWIDGKLAPKNDELLEQIHAYMAKNVLSEGPVSHGHFPIKYVNVKGGKSYNGVTNFLRFFHDLFISDPIHEKRIQEKERFLEKKLKGPFKNTEIADINKRIFQLERDIRSERDPIAKERLRALIKDLQRILKDTAMGLSEEEQEDLRELAEMKKQEAQLLHTRILEEKETKKSFSIIYSATFPDVSEQGSKDLIDIFRKYGLMNNPNPLSWLESKDVIVLARTLRAFILSAMKKEIALKKKGKKPAEVSMSKEDWLEDLKRPYIDDLKKAEKVFPTFIRELKPRKEAYKEKFPADYKALEGRRDVSWIENDYKVDEVINRIEKEFTQEIEVEDKKPQPGVKMIERGKFESLKGFLQQLQNGFAKFGEHFRRQKLEPSFGEAASERVQNLRKSQQEQIELIKNIKADISMMEGSEDKVNLTPEDEKLIKEKEALIKKATKEINDLMATTKFLEDIPAINSAKTLLGYIKYFSSLFTDLKSVLWYRDKYILADYDDPTDISIEDMERFADKAEKKPLGKDQLISLQEKIADTADRISQLPISAKNEIGASLTNLRTMLNTFVENALKLRDTYLAEYNQAHKTAEKKEPKKEDSKSKEEYDKKYTEYVIPGDMLHQAQAILNKLHNPPKELKKLKDFAPVAQKEFDTLVPNLVALHKEGFTPDDVEHLVSKENGKITKSEAAVQLKKHIDALIAAAIETFVENWGDIAQYGPKSEKKERTPLGNQPASDYEIMNAFVKDHLPDLYDQALPESKAPSSLPGDPPKMSLEKFNDWKKLRDRVEKTWKVHKNPTPEEMRHLWYMEAEDMGMGGGAGKAGKARKKVIKPNPPSQVWEKMKNNVAKMVNNTPAEEIIWDILMPQLIQVKKNLKNLKEGEYISPDDVVDTLVYLLKQFHIALINLKIGPSSFIQMPPAGAPRYIGTPDIPINNYDEAVKVFDKYESIYKYLNRYLAPHKIFNMPMSLKGIKKLDKFLPNGLIEWLDYFQRNEGNSLNVPAEGVTPEKGDKYVPLKHIPGPAEKKMKEHSEKLRKDPKLVPPMTGKPNVDYGNYTDKLEGKTAEDSVDYLSRSVAARFIGRDLPDEDSLLS